MNTQHYAGKMQEKPLWAAVFSMALGVFALVTAEFLPASLLTPMAASLDTSEGIVGQAVTVTAVFALLTSFYIGSVTRSLDRRRVMLWLSLMLIASNLLVALAPNLPMLLVGRVLLGISTGGFWTLSVAITMRLVPEAMLPRALSVVYSGVSVATIVSVPMGSYFGHLIGWRYVFVTAAAIGLLGLIWQVASLPKLAPNLSGRDHSLLPLIRCPGMQTVLLAIILLFSAHFAFFTYLRPFLEGITGIGINRLSAILLGFGVANFTGTLIAGVLLERHMHRTLIATPLVMAVTGIGLVAMAQSVLVDAVLVAVWGMAYGAVPVGWSTWISRTMPDEAESGGGLLVAAVQLAITIGAAAGGVIFSVSGSKGVFWGSTLALFIASLTIYAAFRSKPAMA